ncbi:hypothetical protein C8J32_10431 [Rhizobium sp. PP-CC-3A-592]|nr:hypothetical protein C8J32_10431 [Rhizobium sp. PP-CC-3A-592]
MTVLICLKTRDCIFAASDSQTYAVGTTQVGEPQDKIRRVGSFGLWMLGGVMNAIPELEPMLDSAQDIEALDGRMQHEGTDAFVRWGEKAKHLNLDNVGIYSIVAGFDQRNETRLFSHLFRNNEHKEFTGDNQYIVLATDTSHVQKLAEARIASHIVRSGSGHTIQADAWAADIVALAAEKFPVEIGFPVRMYLLRRESLPQTKLVAKRGAAPEHAWVVPLDPF